MLPYASAGILILKRMKTIQQISKQYNIAKTTLISRIKREKMIVLKSNKSFFITHEQEKILTKPILQQYKGLINKNVSSILVWQCKIDNPDLSVFEISELLSIRENSVENILMNDEIVLASKMNL